MIVRFLDNLFVVPLAFEDSDIRVVVNQGIAA